MPPSKPTGCRRDLLPHLQLQGSLEVYLPEKKEVILAYPLEPWECFMMKAHES